MNGISIIMLCEANRLPLLYNTIEEYSRQGILDEVEFVFPTRTLDVSMLPESIRSISNVVCYEGGGPYFNPAKGLNIGTTAAKYDNIIITCPEVIPITNVLKQFSMLSRGNYVCQVYDLNKDGTIRLSLVNKHYRGNTPGFYFLAMYRIEDILAINGWDEEFCAGKAYEDEDFGKRWVRAGIPFEVREEILANHQWHPRNDVREGLEINKHIMKRHDDNKVIIAEKGINQYV